MSDRFYRLSFLTGSLYNILAGAICLVWYRMALEVFFGPQPEYDNLVAGLFFRLLMAAVIIFGVGYFMVYRDLKKNRGIVWLGAVSKLILIIVFYCCYFSGDARIYLLLAMAPDLLFMLVFFLFLWQRRADA